MRCYIRSFVSMRNLLMENSEDPPIVIWAGFTLLNGDYMPYSPKKPCKYPGCNQLTNGTYCPTHAALMYKRYNQERRDPAINKRYKNDEWKQIREQYIVAKPFCEICRKYGRLVKAVEVHHIVPLAEGGSNRFTNLISLCHRCHAKIHAERGDNLNKKKEYTY